MQLLTVDSFTRLHFSFGLGMFYCMQGRVKLQRYCNVVIHCFGNSFVFLLLQHLWELVCHTLRYIVVASRWECRLFVSFLLDKALLAFVWSELEAVSLVIWPFGRLSLGKLDGETLLHVWSVQVFFVIVAESSITFTILLQTCFSLIFMDFHVLASDLAVLSLRLC